VRAAREEHVAVTSRGVLFIVSSPSGGGKTTLIRQAIERLAGHGIPAHFSVSHTTRAPRPSETDGRDYHFVDPATFEAMVERGEFLEWAEYAGSRYGTSREEVEGHLVAGQDVFLDIEVQGANQVKASYDDVVKVFVFPPSFETLKQRLMQRRQDPPEAILRRLKWASTELAVAGEFDYAIINDRLEEAVRALESVCLAEHQSLRRMKPRLDELREDFARDLTKDIIT
jgi:guanylate kinase